MSSGGVAGLEAALPLRKLGGERIGDATDFAIKHGGIAAQQADVALQAIGAFVGFAPEPRRAIRSSTGACWRAAGRAT